MSGSCESSPSNLAFKFFFIGAIFSVWAILVESLSGRSKQAIILGVVGACFIIGAIICCCRSGARTNSRYQPLRSGGTTVYGQAIESMSQVPS